MNLGIFARTFPRPSLDGVLDAIAAHGLRHVQFNLLCAGLATLPDSLPPSDVRRIRRAFDTRDLEMAAISGTFNLIDPDVRKRSDGLRRLSVLADACGALDTSIITLCTGTRDREDMWSGHPENASPAAWADLLRSMEAALGIAERSGITLAVEPEVNNVMDSAVRARALLDFFDSPYLKVVMDPANLFHAGEISRMREVLDQAFQLLAPDIVIAHAKDLRADGDAGHEAAGTGLLDYTHYLNHLRLMGFEGPLILHSLREDQVPGAIDFLYKKISETAAASRID